MPKIDFSQLPLIKMLEGIHRQSISGRHMTIARFQLEFDAIVPEHSHPNEQISLVLEGKVEYVIPNETIIATSGEFVIIPPNSPHAAKAVSETGAVVLDIFSPIRTDF